MNIYRPIILFFFFYVIFISLPIHAQEEQPYKLETEWGDVIGEGGKVEQKGEMPPIPKDTPSTAPIPPILTPAPTSYPIPQSQPVILKRTTPTPLTIPETKPASETPPEIESTPKPPPTKKTPPEKNNEKKKKKQDKETTPAKPESTTDKTVKPPKKRPETVAPATTETTKPITSKSETPASKPTTSPSPIPSGPRVPLSNIVTFTFDGAGMEYDMKHKAARALHAAYSQDSFYVYADEIHLDLHNNILYAAGHIFAADSGSQQSHFTGDTLVWNMATNEGRITRAPRTTFFSYVSIESDYEYPRSNSVQSATRLMTAAGAPSVDAVSEIIFQPDAETDILRARQMRASSGSRLSFTGVEYTDSRGKHSLPSFVTYSGEMRDKTFQLKTMDLQYTPGLKYKFASLRSEYLFADNPHGRGGVTDEESHIWDNPGKLNEHNFNYSIYKDYIRGNHELDLSVSRYDEILNKNLNYKHSWFPGSGGFFTFSSNNNFYDAEDRQSYNFKNSEIQYHSSGNHIITNAYFELQNFSNQGLNNSPNYFFETKSKSSNGSISFSLKPFSIANDAILFGMNYSISSYGAIYHQTQYDSYFTNRDYQYRSQSKNFTASLFSHRKDFAPHLTGTLRANWIYSSLGTSMNYSNSYTFPAYQIYNYIDGSSYGTESARGIAGLEWRFMRNGLLGVDYVAERESREGTGYFAARMAFSNNSKWQLRLSANYRHELTAENVDYPQNVMGETADFTYRLNSRSSLAATFDLDNSRNGASLYRLRYLMEFPSGILTFNVNKYITIKYKNNYTSHYVTPYRYSLTFTFN